MRKLVFIILIVIFSAIYYYSNTLNDGSVVHNTVSKLGLLIKNSTPLTADKLNKPSEEPFSEPEGLSQNSANQVTTKNTNLQELAPDELKKWIEVESRAMNSTKNESDEQQIRLRAQAQALLPQQLAILKDLAVNSGEAINERILSAYMISLNPSAQSQEALFNVAGTAVPDLGPILPHSEAELKHTQELALRYMQVDELFQRAKTDANARDKLKLLVLEAHSAQVRSYAEKRLKELK